MDFQRPLILMALLPLVLALYLTGRARIARLPWLRGLITLVLRLAIVVLLVLALADPRVTRAAMGLHVVFVVDRSASIDPATRRNEMTWLQAALQARHAGDSASLVDFGASPTWSGPLAGASLPPASPVDGSGTNIDAALRLALSTLPANQPSRLVLLSDGRQTAGDALRAAQLAAATAVPIAVVPLLSTHPGDVAVTSLQVPSSTRAGDHITLRVGVYADRATTARLHLLVDGVPLGEEALALHAGASTFLFAVTVALPGIHTYTATVSAPGDPVPQNNSLDAVTITAAAPRVLLLATDAGAVAPVQQVLRAGGLRVTVGAAAQAPTTVSAYSAYDAIVLDDLPATGLPAAALAALQTAVRVHGVGLLVTGGPHSFTAGGYAGSALESLLPVTSLALAHTGRAQVGLILIIDKSGSMMDDVQGVTKISMAQQAAVDAMTHLSPGDAFGVITFDDSTHVVVPYGPIGGAAQQAQARRAILAIEPFGNTVIYPALRTAASDLFASHVAFKHIVLMTDGQGETAPFPRLIKQMHANNITLSTIAIGTDAEVDELRTFANAGGGRFYYAADPHEIPRVVVLETRISSGPTEVAGAISVRQAANTPALRSFVGHALPPLRTYNIVSPRDSAQVLLQSTLGDPLLAAWQVGLGRVAAWTGGSSAAWAASWLQQPAFWSNTVRDLMPAAQPQQLQPDLQVDGNTLQVGVDATLPDGRFADLLATRAVVTAPDGTTQQLTLLQDAPGHYSATTPAPRPGVYRVNLAQYDGTTVLQQAMGAITVPYAAAYAPGKPDLNLLNEIASTTGGTALSQPSAAFDTNGLPVYPVQQDIWPLLALLALLLFPLDVAVRVLYVPPAPYGVGGFGRLTGREQIHR